MSFHKKPKTINPDDVDPSVYYYDEVYDDMKDEERVQRDTAASSARSDNQGSKYIKGLLETAELRKTEKEIRKFKKYARDREDAEAQGLLDQTEVYVTATYKRKLEEIDRLDKDKKNRIESEDDLLLNTHKRHSRNRKDSTEIVGNEHVNDDTYESGPSHEIQRKLSQASNATVFEKTPKTQLKTYEDRRRYLRDFLAKRTVGEQFDEAVRRFKARQASGRPMI